MRNSTKSTLHGPWRHALVVTFAAFTALGMAGTPSAAAPNDAFDPTFGNYLPGRSLVTLGSELSGEPFAMTVLAGGRLVLAGYWTESSSRSA